MFANRFPVLVDACSLASTLKRNLLLSLAEAGFYRVRWSKEILDETEKAISQILQRKNDPKAGEKALRARRAMECAFEEASVSVYSQFLPAVNNLPDASDRHVVAAAIKAQAALIVTENLRHFPTDLLKSFNLEAKTTDSFIASTIDLDPGRAVPAIKQMRTRFNRPSIDQEGLLLRMEADGLVETVDALRPHSLSM